MKGGQNENLTRSIDIIQSHAAKNDGNEKLS